MAFWERFILDPASNESKAGEVAWNEGVPSSLRLKVLEASLGEGHTFMELAFVGADAETFPEELVYELESLHTSASFDLSEHELKRVGMILQVHQQTVEREADVDFTPGSLQIIGRLVTSEGLAPARGEGPEERSGEGMGMSMGMGMGMGIGGEGETDGQGGGSSNDHQLVGIFSKINASMSKYLEKVDSEFGVFLSMMEKEMKLLCAHFDAVGIEVTDVQSEVELWVSTVLTDRFPHQLSNRAIDIVTLGGPQRLIVICCAILKLNEKRMLAISERKSLFKYLTTIPDRLDAKDVIQVMALSRQLYTKYASLLTKWREGADKANFEGRSILPSASLPPSMPSMPSTSRPTGSQTPLTDTMSPALRSRPQQFLKASLSLKDRKKENDTLDAGVDSIEVEYEKRENKELDHQRDSLIHELEMLLGKTLSNFPIGRRTLEQALEELRAYAPYRGSDWDGTLKPQGESKRREEMMDSRGSTLDSIQRQALEQGFIPYSQLYQYQDFPCLYMEGYLQKPRTSSATAGLHKRFFVLHGSYITHFRNHKHRRSQRDVAASVRSAIITPINNHPLARHGIEITLPNGTILHTLFADDAQIQAVWISVLQAAAKAED